MTPSTHTIRIATRKSPLALWQAHYVKDALAKSHPELNIEILTFVTEGDRRLDASLATIGGKGLFVKDAAYSHKNRNPIFTLIRQTSDLYPGCTIPHGLPLR